MDIAWLRDTDEEGSDNGYVDSRRVFQLIDGGRVGRRFPRIAPATRCAASAGWSTPSAWAEALIRRIVTAYGPHGATTDRSIEDDLRRFREVHDDPEAGGCPRRGAHGSGSPAVTLDDGPATGSPVEGDPDAPHVGPTRLGGGLDEVGDGNGAIVPDARVSRWELGLIASHWHEVYEGILDAQAAGIAGGSEWRYGAYASYRLKALEPVMAPSDVERLAERHRERAERRESLRRRGCPRGEPTTAFEVVHDPDAGERAYRLEWRLARRPECNPHHATLSSALVEAAPAVTARGSSR